jgi:hypothetical protein
MKDTTWVFHDSILDSVEASDGSEVVIRFVEAYLHVREHFAGSETVTGWVQPTTIHIPRGSISACDFGTAEEGDQLDIWHGRVTVAGALFDGVIPLPFDRVGASEVYLQLNWGGEVSVVGDGVRVELHGTPEFVETIRH